jgi:hypothetical protein
LISLALQITRHTTGFTAAKQAVLVLRRALAASSSHRGL